MNKRISGIVVALGLGAAVVVWAHSDQDMKDMKNIQMSQKVNSAEFQKLKQLVGNWNGTTTHPGTKMPSEPVSVSFQMTAAGSAVQETLMKGTPHEMVDMYVDEGGKLSMTHYCAIGNQPHLLLKQSGPHVISLEMGPTPGIASKDMHMHKLTLEFPDADHLTERWTSYANGQPAEEVVMTMARVK